MPRAVQREKSTNVLDEIDRLIDEGVYENVPDERVKQEPSWLAYDPTMPKAHAPSGSMNSGTNSPSGWPRMAVWGLACLRATGRPLSGLAGICN